MGTSVDELSEAHEHLGVLISKLGSASEYDEEWLRVDMGHLMAHLNRAWARRNCARSLTTRNGSNFGSTRRICVQSPNQQQSLRYEMQPLPAHETMKGF